MAKSPPSNTAEAPPTTNRPSMKLVIIIAAVMAIIGIGVGFGAGLMSYKSSAVNEEVATGPENSATGKEETGGEIKAGDAAKGDSAHEAPKGDSAHEAPETAGDNEGTGAEHKEGAAADDHAGPQSIVLEPVVTNISTPSDVWVRFESVLKASEPIAKETTDLIHQDYMSFLRTMRLEDLEGASSFLDLKAELLSRANARADGKVESIYIKTLLFE